MFEKGKLEKGKLEKGKKWLLTTEEWFMAADGNLYRAVHGTVTAILNAEDGLGLFSRGYSTNWYIQIGDLLVSSSHVHYAIQTDKVSSDMPIRGELNGHDGGAIYITT